MVRYYPFFIMTDPFIFTAVGHRLSYKTTDKVYIIIQELRLDFSPKLVLLIL